MSDWIFRRWKALTLGSVSLLLLFVNLGNQYPQVDEANTMAIAENVLRFGYPTIWNGEYLVSPYFDGDLTENLVWISHPWLQFYVAASSFAVFGLNFTAARFPFAVAGLLSVIAIFYLARRMSGSTPLAWLTAWLLLLHPGFLLAARQSRYHSLTFLFSILAVLTFLRWVKEPGKWNLLWFVLASAMLFHAYYPYWFFLMLGIGIYFVFIERRWRLVPAFGVILASIAVLTLPWQFWANPQPPVDTGPDFQIWGRHLVIYLWKIHTWVAPLGTLLLIVGAMALLRRTGLIPKEEADRLPVNKTYLIFLFIVFYTAFISVIPILTTQYVSPAIPFLTILAAYLLWKIREYKRWVGAVVLTLFLTTNVWHVFPYVLAEKSGIPARTLEGVIPNARCNFVIGPSLEHYLKDQLVIQSDLFDFLSSLVFDYDNRVEGIITTLNRHGSKNQTVYTSWGDANAIRFSTRMNVVYNFFPRFKNPKVKALVNRPGTRIDWIVPDTLKFYPPSDPFFKFDPDDYERVPVHYPKTYFDNTFNLDEAFYRSDREVPQMFYLLKRKGIEGLAPAGNFTEHKR